MLHTQTVIIMIDKLPAHHEKAHQSWTGRHAHGLRCSTGNWSCNSENLCSDLPLPTWAIAALVAPPTIHQSMGTYARVCVASPIPRFQPQRSPWVSLHASPFPAFRHSLQDVQGQLLGTLPHALTEQSLVWHKIIPARPYDPSKTSSTKGFNSPPQVCI